ncbi:carboxylesterase family protein, partial [Bacillus subtilis]
GGGDPGEFSEDCLYLNVWTPDVAPVNPLPVMVWLHGGGYTIGAGGLAPYNGKPMASRGAVVVTLNYRLGHLGFFSHPALD